MGSSAGPAAPRWPTCCAGWSQASCRGPTPRRSSSSISSRGRRSAAIVESRGLRQISDAGSIGPIVDSVLAANPAAIADHRAGKPSLKFLVGQVMKASRGQANAALVETALRERLGEPGSPGEG